jgi:NTE family protein
VFGPDPSSLSPVSVDGPHPREMLRRARARELGGEGERARSRAKRREEASDDWPTAFVFAGGANRGACQVGMLKALAERGIRADLVTGTSVGAINAAGYVGRPTMEGIYLAQSIWRGLSTEDIFPRGRLHGSWRFVEKRDAVFPISGLRKVIEGFLRFERLEDALIPLTVVASRVADGAEQWFTAGAAVDAVLASAALPAVFSAVEASGSKFIDGGLMNNVPITPALAAGARRIFVLLCGAINHPMTETRRPFEALLSAFDLALIARLRRDLASIPPDVDVIVFEQPGLQHIDWQDFSHTEELIESGYRAARDLLDHYQEIEAAAAGGDRGTVMARFLHRT